MKNEASTRRKTPNTCFPDNPTYTGRMQIQSGNRPPFKNRYFCLKNNFLLSAYSSRSSEQERIIFLAGANISAWPRKNSFEITTGEKTYYFKCSSSAECKLWVDHIEKASRLKLEDLYKIGRSLGRSESLNSKVVSAVHRATGNRVAIKIINKDLCEHSRLFTEVQALKRIKKHDCVVELLDIFETRKYLHLVMELCEGGELLERASICDREPFDEIECCRIIHQVARGVKYIHSHGIVHRDLKPANILWKDKNSTEIRVADFGISKVLEGEETHMRSQIGTLFYLAPEVVKQWPYDKRVDYWSIGVIMHLLLSGKLPFRGERDTQIIKSIVSDDIHLNTKEWTHVSIPVKDLVKKLLSRDSEKRGTLDDVLMVTWCSFTQLESVRLSGDNLYRLLEGPKSRRESLPEISILGKWSKPLSKQREFRKNIFDCKWDLEETEICKPQTKFLKSGSVDEPIKEIRAVAKPTKRRLRSAYIPIMNAKLFRKALTSENYGKRDSLTKKMANNWQSGLVDESDHSYREFPGIRRNELPKKNALLSALRLKDYDQQRRFVDDSDDDEKFDIKPLSHSIASIHRRREYLKNDSQIDLGSPKTPSPRELSPARLLRQFAKNTCEKSKQCTTSFSDRIKALKIKVPMPEFRSNLPKQLKNQSVMALSPIETNSYYL